MGRKTYIDVLNVVSALCVVYLHFNGSFWTFTGDSAWAASNFVETVCFFAVPMFFMISGVNLIDYRLRYSTGDYVRKRISKAVIPFLIWYTAYLLVMRAFGKIDMGENLPMFLLSNLFCRQFFSVFWFFGPLFTAYLCIPFLGLVAQDSRRSAFGAMIALGFGLNMLLPFLCAVWTRLVPSVPLSMGISFPLGGDYLIFVLMGYWIDRYPLEKKQRLWIYALGLLGFLTHWLGTWYLSMQAGTVDELFKGYVNVPSVLQAGAVFTWFRYLDYRKWNKKVMAVIGFLRGETFAVYVLHMYAVFLASKVLDIHDRHVLVKLLVATCAYLGISVCTRMARKCKWIDKILP